MNSGTNFLLIVSLLFALAVAGASTNVQVDSKSSEPRETPPSRIALNHNETMLGTSLAVGQAYTVANLWASIQAFFSPR